MNQGKVDWITNYTKHRLEQLNRTVDLGRQMGDGPIANEEAYIND